MKLHVRIYLEDNPFTLNVKDDATLDEIQEHVECYSEDWDQIEVKDGDFEGTIIKRPWRCFDGTIQTTANL